MRFNHYGEVQQLTWVNSIGGLPDGLQRWAGGVHGDALSDLARKIREGKVKLPLVGKTFRLDEIVEAHRFIENKAVGKIVVLV